MNAVTTLLAGVIVLLGIAIWSIKRHRDPALVIETDAPFEKLTASLSGIALGTPIGGNAVEILENGLFFDALLADIAEATRSVHFETFLWKEGRLGKRMADAFSARALAGVKVRLVLDANGCKKMGSEPQRQMREAGCQLAYYHPRTLRNIGVVLERDHRKIAVLDGRIAYVGGHCVADEWLGDAQDRAHTRDLSVRLRGPAVQAVQSVFSENWVEVTGRMFAGEDVFPPLQDTGAVVAHVASVKPEGSPPAVKMLYYAALCCAKKRIWIQNPYFIPPAEAIEGLAKALGRGVDVRVMVPSAGASDMRLVQHAAHRNFQALLDSGIRIFEYARTLLHQKAITVDGVWCAIGSSNFDDRSLETNDEIMIGLQDEALARRLEEIFESDRAHCTELERHSWKRRALWCRVQDVALHRLHEVL